MKIFNWVHRKLKDGTGTNGQKEMKRNGIYNHMCDDDDKKKAFGEVVGCWKGGILTIGTFGYGSLGKEEDEYDQESLVLLGELEHDDHLLLVDDDKYGDDSELDENDIDGRGQVVDFSTEEEEEEDEDGENQVVNNEHDPSVHYSIMMMSGEQKMMEDDIDSEGKKERITLAELFSADSEEADDHGMCEFEMMKKKKKMKKNGTYGLTLAKKLLPSKASQPIHKLHLMMRKMMKRKIHPAEAHQSHNHTITLTLTQPQANSDNDEDNLNFVGINYESAPLLPLT